jgi:undecaprenyl pyrophosphate phosphatase UppP
VVIGRDYRLWADVVLPLLLCAGLAVLPLRVGPRAVPTVPAVPTGRTRRRWVSPLVVGVAVSAVTGCVVIAWFLHYLRRSGLHPFVYYRIVFGIIVLALAFIRRPA